MKSTRSAAGSDQSCAASTMTVNKIIHGTGLPVICREHSQARKRTTQWKEVRTHSAVDFLLQREQPRTLTPETGCHSERRAVNSWEETTRSPIRAQRTITSPESLVSPAALVGLAAPSKEEPTQVWLKEADERELCVPVASWAEADPI